MAAMESAIKENNVLAIAQQELLEEQKQSKTKVEQFLYEIHDRYVNEEDFVDGKESYTQFVEDYISLMYAPLDEEFDEERYFTKDFDRNLFKKMRLKRCQKLVNIEIK